MASRPVAMPPAHACADCKWQRGVDVRRSKYRVGGLYLDDAVVQICNEVRKWFFPPLLCALDTH